MKLRKNKNKKKKHEARELAADLAVEVAAETSVPLLRAVGAAVIGFIEAL